MPSNTIRRTKSPLTGVTKHELDMHLNNPILTAELRDLQLLGAMEAWWIALKALEQGWFDEFKTLRSENVIMTDHIQTNRSKIKECDFTREYRPWIHIAQKKQVLGSESFEWVLEITE